MTPLTRAWLRKAEADLKVARRELTPNKNLTCGLLACIGHDRHTLCEVGRTPQTVEDGAEILKYYAALWRELASPR